MSRTYKLLIYKQSPSRNKGYWKRQAAKRVRRADIDNHAHYKRVYCSWNIADYKSDGRYGKGWGKPNHFKRNGVWHAWR
jgi:hypothetical protein